MSLQPGQKVIWLATIPGGWNLTIRVPATVVRMTPKRVCIDAEMNGGWTSRRYVKPDTLETKKL